jgi:hypothetical protein
MKSFHQLIEAGSRYGKVEKGQVPLKLRRNQNRDILPEKVSNEETGK